MAVIDESSHDLRVTKIHAQAHAGILRAEAIPVGNVDGVTQEWLVEWNLVPFRQQKMDLVNVECVELLRAVLDHPIFHVALLHRNVRSDRVWIEYFLLLAFHGDVELGGTVWIFGVLRFFEKIQLSLADGFDVAEPCSRRRTQWDCSMLGRGCE